MNSRFDHHFVLKFALVQAKLALVSTRSDVLSDLNDLKETKKLDTDLSELISDNFKSGLIPRNPLAFVDSEITSLVSWGKEVQKSIDHGDDLLSPEQLIEEGQKAGIEKMRQLQLKIEVFQSEILPKAADLRSKIPKQYFIGNTLDPVIIEIWQLRLAAGAKLNKIINLSKLIGWLGQTEEKQEKVLDLKKSLEAHSKLIEKLTAKAKSQLNDLDDAILKLEYGNLSEAGNLLDSRSNENRFYDSRDEQWSVLESKINYFYKSLKDIKSAGSPSKIIRAIDYIKLEDNWRKVDPFSELGLELKKIQKEANKNITKFRLAVLIVAAIAGFFIFNKYYTYTSNKRIYEESKRNHQLAQADLEEKLRERQITFNQSQKKFFKRAEDLRKAFNTSLATGSAVVAWGKGEYGQCSIPQGLEGILAISAGGDHSLAILSEGRVEAWGSNNRGQCTIPKIQKGVLAIAAGGNHSLALMWDRTVVAWGYNGYGQTTIPAGLANVLAIAAGGNHSIALLSDGTVTAWGHSANGQINIPQGLNSVVAIAAGDWHSMALLVDGTVVTWGGSGLEKSTIPAGLSDVVAIAAGSNHNLALKVDGTVAAWGNNSHGQCTIPQGLHGVVAIAAGDKHSLALKEDGTVVGWGGNEKNESKIPMGLTGVVAISAGGGWHNLALKRVSENQPF
jgi:hypothetical protein